MREIMPKIQTEYKQLPDIKIAFKQFGKGPLLILLHGNSGSKEYFNRYQTDYFSMYHTIAVDSRGHGQSISCDKKYTIKQFSNDIINFCEAGNIKEAYIIGYSDGGNISLFLGEKAPHIFTKIIAISPNYLSSGLKKMPLRIVKVLKKILTIIKYTGIKTEKIIMKLDLILNDIGLTDNDLKNINTDFKIVYAERDIIKENHIERISELIPNCSHQEIKNCNHLTILNKKETIETMKQFLI